MPHQLDTEPVDAPFPDDADLDVAIATFATLRPRLFATASRILGGSGEADDVVQEAWLRWQTCDRSTVRNSTAFLVAATTRLALNVAQSARARRESSVGRWPTEPADGSGDPAAGIERDEALDAGILLLVERCSPAERAAYILRHAFGYPYAQIADMMGLTETNARQVVSRASRHVALTCRRSASTAEHQHLVRAFAAASKHGDVSELENICRRGRRRGVDVAATTGR